MIMMFPSANCCSHSDVAISHNYEVLYKRSEDSAVLEGYKVFYKNHKCVMCGKETRDYEDMERDVSFDIDPNDSVRYTVAVNCKLIG
jgi:hypothetical protein